MIPPPAMKDLENQITEERATLLRAGRHIADGQARLRQQCDLLHEMRTRKLDTSHAERLIQILRGTLEQWELHRVMIGERLAYLEGQRPSDR